MNLLFINDKLQTARYSVDIFGLLKSNNQENKLKELKSLFHLMAKETHADLFTKDEDKKIAHEAFIKLTEWHELAIKDVENDKYGKRDTIKVKTGKNSYIIHGLHKGGDIADILNCTKEGDTKKDLVLKIVREQNNNDLINNEIRILKMFALHTDNFAKLINNHICLPLDVFEIEGKQSIIFEKLDNFISLEDVLIKYPNGIELKHVAWMTNRILGALIITNHFNLIHGALIPSNFLINPENHNGKLIDWCNTIQNSEKLKTKISDCQWYYPPDNIDKLDFGFDIFMFAKLLIQLITGKQSEIPNNIPKPMSNFIRACLLGKAYRPKDANELFSEWQDILKNIFGERKFHKFTI